MNGQRMTTANCVPASQISFGTDPVRIGRLRWLLAAQSV